MHTKVDSVGYVSRGSALQTLEVLSMLVGFDVNVALTTHTRFENDLLILLGREGL